MKGFYVLVALVVAAICVLSSKGQLSAGPTLGAAHTQSYKGMATEDANKYGISSWVFLRQIQAESSWNPTAVSPAGAVGIAQFLPETASSMGVNPWDVSSSLDGAARLDAKFFHEYGSYAKMLAAYNAGADTRYGVNQAVSRCGGAWINCMPLETQSYVRRILG